MRLIDRVVAASAEVDLPDERGRAHRLPGVGSRAEAIRQCELRYILDETASRECMNLVVRPNDGLLDPDNGLLRLPATQFWVEWLGMADCGGHPKVGALVETTEDGLAGCITGYWEDEQGRAVTMGVSIGFDLTQVPRRPSALRHATYEHLNGLLGRTQLALDPCWAAYFRGLPAQPFDDVVQAMANGSWYYAPIVFAFAAMLNSRDVLEQNPSQLERLNRARLRRGREPLLDHIEVRMKLRRSGDNDQAFGHAHLRSSPRLHHVRGHFVHRAGKTFWRASHLRGDAERPIRTKTVMVSVGRPARPSARLISRGQLGATAAG